MLIKWFWWYLLLVCKVNCYYIERVFLDLVDFNYNDDFNYVDILLYFY